MEKVHRPIQGACFAFVFLWLVVTVDGVTLTLDYKSVAVGEKQTTSQELTTATCTPTTAADLCRVSLAGVYPTNPCGNCFAVLPCGTAYCLRYLPGNGVVNPSMADRYTVTLRASDSTDRVSSVVDVHVKPNSPPFFDPGQFGGELHVTEKLANGGFFTVEATDKDNDPLIYSMTTVPDVDGIIQIDSFSGTIRAADNLEKLCRSFVTALVYAKDNYHTEQGGPLAVTIDIDSPNDRPIITNLNTELYVREDEPLDETVYRLAYYDNDGDPLYYDLSAVPASAQDLFRIDRGSGSLRVNGPLDYETYPNGITLNIQATDQRCQSEMYSLQVHLVDINEPPILEPVDQTLETCEGLVDIRPDWTELRDPDADDVIRFTDIQPNDNGRFRIDEKTGVVSTTIDYDLDESELSAKVETVVVTLSDLQGETATAVLNIRFVDCNDNAPEYSVPARQYAVRDCWAAGEVAGTVARADDDDSSYRQNDVFSHSGSAPGVVVQESGSIVLTEKFEAGRTVTFPVYATDKGEVPGPLTSKPFWVSLYTLPCFVPPPDDGDGGGDGEEEGVPANDLDFWDADGPNLGWLIAALLLALPLLALPFYFLWRYWDRIRNCCRRPCCPKGEEPPRRPITPTKRPTPPPERRGPGFIFGWWKETYANNDYGENLPNHNALPEPTHGPEPLDTNTYDFEPDPEPIKDISTPPPPRNSCHIL